MKLHKNIKIEEACSKDKTRAAICEPYLDLSEPEKPVVVATDGRIMAVVPQDPTCVHGDTEGYVNKLALKDARKGCAEAVVECNGTARSIGSGVEYPRHGEGNVDFQFPNWRQVFNLVDPGEEGVVSVALNTEFLSRLANAMGSKCVRLVIKSPDDLVTVIPTKSEGFPMSDPDARGIIMPIRVS